MKNYNFDNIIKDKVAGHEAPVPADAWDNIKKEKKKRPGIFWWAFAALFIGFSLFGVYEMKYKKVPPLTAHKIADEKNTTAPIQSKHINTLHEMPIVTDSIEHKEGLTNKTNTHTAIVPADNAVMNTGNTDVTKTKNSSSSLHKKPADLNKSKNTKKYNNAAAVIATTGNTTSKNKTKSTGKDDLLHTGEVDATSTTLAKPSLNKKTKSLNRYGKKVNADYESITSNDIVATKTKIKKTGINKKDNKEYLLADAKNKKTFRGKTIAKITAPATDEAGENEMTDATATTKDEKIKRVEPADSSKDSLKNKPELVVNKQWPNTDSAVKPAPKETKQSKRNLFVDVGVMPFVAVQNNAALINIKRTTATSLSRSEFIADEISSTVNASFSYSIALHKKLTGKWHAGIGLQYTQIKETIKLSGKETNTRFSVIKRLDNTGSFLVDDTVATVTSGKRIIDATNSYEFISIPVFAQYSLWEKKAWSLSLNGGLIFNIKSTYKNSIEGLLIPTYSSSTMANKKERKLTTDVFASMRLARAIGKNYKIFAEPGVQFNLQKFNMVDMINYKNIHRAGLTVGFTYQLNF